MKTLCRKLSVFVTAASLMFILSTCRTPEWAIPAELAGDWHAETAPVTSRQNVGFMKFTFIQDWAAADLVIRADKTASGTIGNATFENARVRLNSGNPEKTGVAYIVDCGKVGKIFETDPVEQKEVQLWLHPLKGDMTAGLRMTEKGAAFPMGSFIFVKKR